MRNKILIPILLVVLALVLQGCLPQAPQPQTIDQEAVDRAVQQTLQALSLFQTATAVAQPVVMESPTALPTFTGCPANRNGCTCTDPHNRAFPHSRAHRNTGSANADTCTDADTFRTHGQRERKHQLPQWPFSFL
jgi:hypothetical protein